MTAPGRLETTPPRNQECCVRYGCTYRAILRFDGEALCATDFPKAFDRAVMDAKIQSLIDLVRANGFMEITWLGDVSLAQLAEASV